MKLTLTILVVLVIVATVLFAAGSHAWRARTAAAVARLEPTVPTAYAARFSAVELRDLPPPVQRYFRAALREGQPIVHHVRLHQRGQFLVRAEKNAWGPFTATQDMAPLPPGFVWDARIRMAPGLRVWVRDALVDGRGSMHGSVLGMRTVLRIEDTPEIAAGALQRYLAEAVWAPTSLLPWSGVQWTPIDDSTARATLAAGATTVSVDFHFGPDSMVQSIYVPDRPRQFGGGFVPTPWRGRWFTYGERSGMRIPLTGEVEWVLPEGPQPYWRGEIVDVAYDFGDRR